MESVPYHMTKAWQAQQDYNAAIHRAYNHYLGNCPFRTEELAKTSLRAFNRLDSAALDSGGLQWPELSG